MAEPEFTKVREELLEEIAAGAISPHAEKMFTAMARGCKKEGLTKEECIKRLTMGLYEGRDDFVEIIERVYSLPFV